MHPQISQLTTGRLPDSINVRLLRPICAHVELTTASLCRLSTNCEGSHHHTLGSRGPRICSDQGIPAPPPSPRPYSCLLMTQAPYTNSGAAEPLPDFAQCFPLISTDVTASPRFFELPERRSPAAAPSCSPVFPDYRIAPPMSMWSAGALCVPPSPFGDLEYSRYGRARRCSGIWFSLRSDAREPRTVRRFR